MHNPATNGPCPICDGPLAIAVQKRPNNIRRVHCLNCGDHRFSEEAVEDVPQLLAKPGLKAAVAYLVARRPADDTITSAEMGHMAKVAKLPPAMERIDNLLIYLGDKTEPGDRFSLYPNQLCATLGTKYREQSRWVLEEALARGLIACQLIHDTWTDWSMEDATMTAKGWEHRDQRLRNGAGSRHAFMAMDFNQTELWQLFANHLKPAVAQTGFDLRTTDHDQKTAGLIDNRMRVEIRTSRFVVCDLTHGNRGAYWEAGFAEGIGRPVFYICRHDVRSSTDKAVRPHFDAEHQSIVAWNPEDPGPGLMELKAMIRATLPAEARMKDPDGT